jgi:hypothetical protein
MDDGESNWCIKVAVSHLEFPEEKKTPLRVKLDSKCAKKPIYDIFTFQ